MDRWDVIVDRWDVIVVGHFTSRAPPVPDAGEGPMRDVGRDGHVEPQVLPIHGVPLPVFLQSSTRTCRRILAARYGRRGPRAVARGATRSGAGGTAGGRMDVRRWARGTARCSRSPAWAYRDRRQPASRRCRNCELSWLGSEPMPPWPCSSAARRLRWDLGRRHAEVGGWRTVVLVTDEDQAEVSVEVRTYERGQPGCAERVQGARSDWGQPQFVASTLKVAFCKAISRHMWCAGPRPGSAKLRPPCRFEPRTCDRHAPGSRPRASPIVSRSPD